MPTPMTSHGEKLLQEELTYLKGTRRPEISKAIAEARAHGDLKENAEYHAAREQQGFIEARLNMIESKLSDAQVIDITLIPNTGRVIFGSTVTLENVDTGEQTVYQMVGDDEADIKAKKISCNAPLSRAIIAKQLDDEIDFTTPDGTITTYAIIKIEHI
jgi:transcription elongation factor GreA